MRTLAALTFCLGLSPTLWAQTFPCIDPLSPLCQVQQVRGTVIGKTVADPLKDASLSLSGTVSTPGGSIARIDSVIFEGLLMTRVTNDLKSPGAISFFVLSRPDPAPPVLAWLENAVDGGRTSDWVLLNTKHPTDISFLYANGLQPGEASAWVVDTAAGAGFAPLGLGSVGDMLGTVSAAQPLLAAVPEPASAGLLLAGLLAARLVFGRRLPRP